MNVTNYKELIVWQKSMDLVKDIYLITNSFPAEEKYGLASQMRRCAVSIPSNIAEGYRRGTKEYRHFLSISDGSSAELETQLLIAESLYQHIHYQKSYGLIIEIQKMLSTIMRNLT